VRPTSPRKESDQHLLKKIKTIFKEHLKTYGSPRIHEALRKMGIFVSRKRIARLMRDNALVARANRIYQHKPGTKRYLETMINIRKDMAKPTGINQQWAADLTYLRLGRKWVYLSVVIDLYSRRVIGWAMGHKKDVELTHESIRRAIVNRKPAPGLVFHTDRGAEYRAYAIGDLLAKYEIVASANRPGRCTDNAEMESFFHTLKSDVIHGYRFDDYWTLRDLVAGYIQHFYNRKRIHSSLDFNSPVEYETMAT
jgi:transposase InsO family protein